MPSPHRHPRSVFVSYSRQDAWFVDLMVELLTFHRIRPWHDKRDVTPASSVSDSVREGLQRTESMIVVLSPHSLGSRWVSQELFAFAALHGTERIFPLKLRDYADNDGVFHELRDRQAINFSGNMLQGFRELTEAFGKPFLPPVERRTATPDRRLSNVAARLEFDFHQVLKRYPDVHRSEPMSQAEQGQLFVEVVEAFHEVLHRGYRLFDRRTHQPVSMPAAFLEELTIGSIEGFDALERLVPDFFITAVVRRLLQMLRVVPRDRRQEPGPEPLLAA